MLQHSQTYLTRCAFLFPIAVLPSPLCATVETALVEFLLSSMSVSGWRFSIARRYWARRQRKVFFRCQNIGCHSILTNEAAAAGNASGAFVIRWMDVYRSTYIMILLYIDINTKQSSQYHSLWLLLRCLLWLLLFWPLHTFPLLLSVRVRLNRSPFKLKSHTSLFSITGLVSWIHQACLT